MKYSTILIFTALTLSIANAQDQISDRPAGTESTELVKPGYVIVEFDYLYTNNGKQRIHELPQILTRIALSKKVEAMLGWDGYLLSESEKNDGTPRKYIVGFKTSLTDERGYLPETAFFAALSTPSVLSDITHDALEPDIRFLFKHTLSETLTLEYNLGIETFDTDSSLLYTLIFEKECFNKWTSALELSGYKKIDTQGKAFALSKNISYEFNENLELRFQAGFENTDNTDNLNNIFLDIGASYQFKR